MLNPEVSYQGDIPPLTKEEIDRAIRLRANVNMLAGTIGERNTANKEELILAELFIADGFGELVYECEKEIYRSGGVDVANILVEIKGNRKPDEILVIGAHYDSAIGTPGANDNASAVAVLLELARLFRHRQTERTIRFIAFVNEEPPYSFTDLMGSCVNASNSRKRDENIVAMVCLECLGIYADEPGSQQYPAHLTGHLPDTANFITFCSNSSSEPLLQKCIEEFRSTTAFPSEFIVDHGEFNEVGWSDHWSFWLEGYQAIMITDTAFFRYDGYHQGTDTPDRLDYERMARLTSGISAVINKLAGKP